MASIPTLSHPEFTFVFSQCAVLIMPSVHSLCVLLQPASVLPA